MFHMEIHKKMDKFRRGPGAGLRWFNRQSNDKKAFIVLIILIILNYILGFIAIKLIGQ